MDENTEAHEASAPLEVTAPSDAPPEGSSDTTEARSTLHRSTKKKIFGGVAGGIGERFDVDANIVRVVFVVLALLWGLGVAIYLAMWVLIPRAAVADGDVPEEVDEESGRRFHWLRYALPLGLIVLVAIFFAAIHGRPRLGAGFSLFWLLFVVVLAALALRTPASRFTLRRFFALCFLAFVTFLVLLTGTTLIALAVIGVPLRGGSGVRVWHPTSVSEVRSVYRGAFGTSTIDLVNVPFARQTYSIKATQGMGVLTVDVPADVTIDLQTHVGIGSVTRFNAYYLNYTPPPKTATAHEAHLRLNLQVGVGRVRVVRYR
jgi:phage shock protein PspC (stress-responsive transcriptional regulator)